MYSLKKYIFLLSFLFMTMPLMYIEGSNATHSTQDLFTAQEIQQEINQITDFHIPAPEFPDDQDWFNTSDRLFLQDLRGKIVVISFWSLGSQESIKLHQKLGQIKNKYKDRVVFIDVQSPYYYNSMDRKWIEDAVRKYKLKNPVIFDRNNQICQSFNVNRFPTFCFINQEGNYSGYLTGLDKIRYLETYIQNMPEM